MLPQVLLLNDATNVAFVIIVIVVTGVPSLLFRLLVQRLAYNGGYSYCSSVQCFTGFIFKYTALISEQIDIMIDQHHQVQVNKKNRLNHITCRPS